MKNIKKTAGKLFAMILTVSVAVSCVVSTGIFTASAYTAPKKGKIVYNKTIHNKYSKVENTILDSLKNFDEKIDISSLNVPRSDIAEFFKVLTLTHPELYYVNQGFSYSYYPSQRIRLRQSIPSTQSARASMQHRKSRLIKRLREFFRLWTRI